MLKAYRSESLPTKVTTYAKLASRTTNGPFSVVAKNTAWNLSVGSRANQNLTPGPPETIRSLEGKAALERIGA